jgi:hypothetical protein
MIVLTTIINLSLNCPLSIYITYGSYQSRQTAALMFFLYYALILSEKTLTSKHTLLFGDFHYISILTYHADLMVDCHFIAILPSPTGQLLVPQ